MNEEYLRKEFLGPKSAEGITKRFLRYSHLPNFKQPEDEL